MANPSITMLRPALFLATFALTQLSFGSSEEKADWMVLFDGTNLDGWKSNDETPNVFTLTDSGELRVDGGRAHLFWMGRDDIPAQFNDFELRMKVKTMPMANSGLFFHTVYQEKGWPLVGLEAQVNSTHKDRRKTGSIYAKQDVMDDAPSTDGEWFNYVVRVDGKTVTISVNGEIINTYTEPADPEVTDDRPDTKLGSGTFAIQGHDPKSVVFYKDIRVRPL